MATQSHSPLVVPDVEFQRDVAQYLALVQSRPIVVAHLDQVGAVLISK